jgi:hypothetical protein
MNDHGSDLSHGPSGPDLTPDELDRLEDALAFLGEPEGRGEIDALPVNLRERLGEYEAIVALAREAMPLEDVPPGVLDGILAEARRVEASAPPRRDRGPGLWERLRRSFALPGLALAGTAAFLLWAVRPVDEQPVIPGASEATPSPAAMRADEAREAGPTVPAPPAPKAMIEAPAEGVAADELKDSPAENGPPAAEAPADAAALPESLPGAATRPSKSGGAKMKKADAEPPPPLPGLDVRDDARVDADKEAVRDQLDDGDRARHRGDCSAAERAYTDVARSNGPAAERARALVGLGLCREAAGDHDAAERYFDEANSLDRGVVKRLRGESELKRAAKPKAASKATADGL